MSAIATAQADALIARVRDEAARRAAELRESTHAECAAIRRQARKDARLRVRAAIAEKRRRITERCRAVDIENEATRRAASFARAREIAGRALAELPGALADRWRDDTARQGWSEAAVECAARVLRGRAWTVEMPAGATAANRDIVEALATRHGALVREWADCDANAGLRIGQDGTWVDATAERLLADRTSLAARLLAELAPGGGS
jgi:hypothetical protein